MFCPQQILRMLTHLSCVMPTNIFRSLSLLILCVFPIVKYSHFIITVPQNTSPTEYCLQHFGRFKPFKPFQIHWSLYKSEGERSPLENWMMIVGNIMKRAVLGSEVLEGNTIMTNTMRAWWIIRVIKVRKFPPFNCPPSPHTKIISTSIKININQLIQKPFKRSLCFSQIHLETKWNVFHSSFCFYMQKLSEKELSSVLIVKVIFIS